MGGERVVGIVDVPCRREKATVAVVGEPLSVVARGLTTPGAPVFAVVVERRSRITGIDERGHSCRHDSSPIDLELLVAAGARIDVLLVDRRMTYAVRLVSGVLGLRHVLVKMQNISQGTESRCPIRLAVHACGCDHVLVAVMAGECAPHRLSRVIQRETIAPRNLFLLRCLKWIDGAAGPNRRGGMSVRQTKHHCVRVRQREIRQRVEKMVAPTVDIYKWIILWLALISEIDTRHLSAVVLSDCSTHQPAVKARGDATISVSTFNARHFLKIKIEGI